MLDDNSPKISSGVLDSASKFCLKLQLIFQIFNNFFKGCPRYC
jgi:hypothetical protein